MHIINLLPIVLVSLSIFSENSLYGMQKEVKDPNANMWIHRLPSEHIEKKLFELPKKFIQRSELITNLIQEFNDKGTENDPLDIVIDSSIDNVTLGNFITSQETLNLITQLKFLSLACYFIMPNQQRQLEYGLRKSFKKLELNQALEQAQKLQELNLSLSPSFLHMIAAKKLSEIFIKIYPPKIVEDKPLSQENIYDQAALSTQPTCFAINKYHSECLAWDSMKIESTLANGIAVSLCRDMTTRQTLHYFSKGMEKPVVLKHDAFINLYAMNAQGDTIVFYDYNSRLGLFYKNESHCAQEESVWTKTILDATATIHYFKVIFSDKGDSFITLNSEKDLENPSTSVEIKVWNVKNNSIVARYTIPSEEQLDSIDFCAHNSRLILSTNQTNFKIFDINAQSIIEEWYDTNAQCRIFHCIQDGNIYKVTKSSTQQYYLLQHPLNLYNRFYQRLIEFTQDFLQTNNAVSEFLTKFDKDDTLLFNSIISDNTFIFDLPGLDTILQEIDQCTLKQAVGVYFLSKGLRAYSQDEATEILGRIAENLPQGIKTLVEKFYTISAAS